jgi:hypothetical protein
VRAGSYGSRGESVHAGGWVHTRERSPSLNSSTQVRPSLGTDTTPRATISGAFILGGKGNVFLFYISLLDGDRTMSVYMVGDRGDIHVYMQIPLFCMQMYVLWYVFLLQRLAHPHWVRQGRLLRQGHLSRQGRVGPGEGCTKRGAGARVKLHAGGCVCARVCRLMCALSPTIVIPGREGWLGSCLGTYCRLQ